MTAWISIHGPMQELIIDGESGVTTSTIMENELKARGIKLNVRAVKQHANYIERRGAILRQSMHAMEGQLKREHITISFAVLLAEATFAGNCLTHVGGVTPYQVVYGRQPSMLPPIAIQDSDMQEDGQSSSYDGPEARVREIALQSMIESTSQARITRALRASTQHPAERIFQRGDVVEYHRNSTSKDVSGWLGPADVVEVLAEQGQLVLRHHNTALRCRIQDARHFIGLGLIVPELVYLNAGNAIDVVTNFVEHQTVGSVPTLFGFTADNKENWRVTRASFTHQDVFDALNYLVLNTFKVSRVIAARLGRGNATLPALPFSTGQIFIFWFSDPTDLQFYENQDTNAINLRTVVGERYPQARYIQLLTSNLENYNMQQYDMNNALQQYPHPDIKDDKSDRLSTIHEGSRENSGSIDHADLLSVFGTFDPSKTQEITEAYIAIKEYDNRILKDLDEEEESEYFLTNPQEPPESTDMDNVMMEEQDGDGKPCVQLYVDHNMEKHFMDLPDHARADQVTICVYQGGSKTVVIKRDTDVLTKDEEIKFVQLLNEAMKEELKIWIKYKCFHMRLKKGAYNIMDSRNVNKWKWVIDDKGGKKRIIRVRLALRGFKDKDADSIETLAGTAARLSQRLLTSEAACHKDE